MAVLDWERVEEIRLSWESGETQSSLSVRFGVSLNTIGKIVKGQSWVRQAAPTRVAGRGVRQLENPEEILRRLLVVQEAYDAREERGLPPTSPLEGGDAPSVEGGTEKLLRVRKEMSDEGTL